MEMTPEKIKASSEVLRDIGQVIFASMFIGPLISGSFNYWMISFGAILSILIWYSSVSIIRR